MESKRKKAKGQKHSKYTEKRKTACGLVSTKASFVAFVENEEVDEDDNHILNGSKLIVTWSESIRSDELTIFENEAVIKFSPLAFYSKIFFKKIRYGEKYFAQASYYKRQGVKI